MSIPPSDLWRHQKIANFANSRPSASNFSITKGETISKASNNFLNSPKTWTKLTILSKEEAQVSELRSFFGRIDDTINCFRDLLTFGKELLAFSVLFSLKIEK